MWNFPLFPEQASTNASRVDAWPSSTLGIVLFFTALICVLILTFAIRYRRGSQVDRSNPPTHGSPARGGLDRHPAGHRRW